MTVMTQQEHVHTLYAGDTVFVILQAGNVSALMVGQDLNVAGVRTPICAIKVMPAV